MCFNHVKWWISDFKLILSQYFYSTLIKRQRFRYKKIDCQNKELISIILNTLLLQFYNEWIDELEFMNF